MLDDTPALRVMVSYQMIAVKQNGEAGAWKRYRLQGPQALSQSSFGMTGPESGRFLLSLSGFLGFGGGGGPGS